MTGSVMNNGSSFIPRERISPFLNPGSMNDEEGLSICWETDPLNPRTVDVREEVMRLTDGDGLDLAVDLAEVNSALDQVESCLGRFGRAVIIGIGPESLQLTESSLHLTYNHHAVLGHDGCEPRDMARLVRLVASGRLDLSRSISHVVPLEDVARGVERLRTKEGNPACIVIKL